MHSAVEEFTWCTFFRRQLAWIKDGNGSVGHMSLIKWVTIFGWILWVTKDDLWLGLWALVLESGAVG